ncbi:MAG: hypothetical protein JXA14_13795, partial [Anaerolineae bacterium]|nr:hypothetical protein [Anaerolineae bacterium]
RKYSPLWAGTRPYTTGFLISPCQGGSRCYNAQGVWQTTHWPSFGNDNKQSLSALIGAVETDTRFDDSEIRLLKSRLSLGEQIDTLTITATTGPSSR